MQSASLSNMSESIQGALTSFAIILTLYLVYVLIQEGRRTRQLMQYEEVQGQITKSLLISDQYDEDGIVYESDIIYEFEVDGEKYTSTNIGATSYAESNEAFHQGLVDQYPKDEAVTVYYQKDNPENCLLQTRLHERYARVALYFTSILLLITVPFSIPNLFPSSKQTVEKKQNLPEQTSLPKIQQPQPPPEMKQPAPFLFSKSRRLRKERPYAANCARFPVTCLRRPVINTPIITGRRDPRIKLNKRY